MFAISEDVNLWGFCNAAIGIPVVFSFLKKVNSKKYPPSEVSCLVFHVLN